MAGHNKRWINNAQNLQDQPYLCNMLLDYQLCPLMAKHQFHFLCQLDYKHLDQYDYVRGVCFQMQKYKKNVGKFNYHIDENINTIEKENRIIVYLWYLNTVDIGGETEVNNSIIKPVAGKLLLFPATWTYPHCGCKPISDDKYIITGWIVHNFY